MHRQSPGVVQYRLCEGNGRQVTQHRAGQEPVERWVSALATGDVPVRLDAPMALLPMLVVDG